MKKINGALSNKDRIICTSAIGKHEFYYQPVDSKEHYWLFNTNGYSRSIFLYFRNKGRRLCDGTYSLTIKELYEFKDYCNQKLTKVMSRIPSHIEHVIHESCIGKETHVQQAPTAKLEPVQTEYEYYEYAA